MKSICISEQTICPPAFIADCTAQHLQGEGNRGLMVQSRLRVPYRRLAVPMVVSGPFDTGDAQQFLVSWAAGEDRARCTFTGALSIGRGIAPNSGSIVLSGQFLSIRGPGKLAMGAGRSIALAVGHALLAELRRAIEDPHAPLDAMARAVLYAWRYRN